MDQYGIVFGSKHLCILINLLSDGHQRWHTDGMLIYSCTQILQMSRGICLLHSKHLTTAQSHMDNTILTPLSLILWQTLEQERDRAENRLKVEQTQRDSIQKLRERNAQLESQLQELCKLQVCICNYNHTYIFQINYRFVFVIIITFIYFKYVFL